jgi:SAM-dependent methyltransferase
MEPTNQRDRAYVLGSDPEELARLDRQAASIERATKVLLQAAGVSVGMRALDLGTGLGHVARLIGQLVGPSGSVVGIDRSEEALRVARRRVEDAGDTHVSFVTGSVNDWQAPEPFDAIVGRLLLFHVADPVAVVRRQLGNLRVGGLFVAIDFDVCAARAEPPVSLVADAVGWVVRAFQVGGASPEIGPRLALVLERAGVQAVSSFGVQSYLAPHDPAGPASLAGVVRSLAPVILQSGIASSEELGIETLERRIADALREADAVLVPPTVAGAWGRRAPAA